MNSLGTELKNLNQMTTACNGDFVNKRVSSYALQHYFNGLFLSIKTGMASLRLEKYNEKEYEDTVLHMPYSPTANSKRGSKLSGSRACVSNIQSSYSKFKYVKQELKFLLHMMYCRPRQGGSRWGHTSRDMKNR